MNNISEILPNIISRKYVSVSHGLYIKLCYVYVKFNEPIKVAHLQKLANQSMLNGARRNSN